MDALFIVCFIGIAVYVLNLRSKINYLKDDNNFKDGVKWPGWLVRDAEEWNRNNPNKQVTIRR